MWTERWHEHRHQAATLGEELTEIRPYVLIDHGAAPGLLAWLRQRPAIKWASLFQGTNEEAALSVAPILVDLGGPSNQSSERALLAWLEQQCTWNNAVILLESHIGLTHLAAALTRRLEAFLPDDMPVLLRFFDTRIFGSLLNVLSDERRTAFLGIADWWWWVDRAGNLQRVRGGGGESDPLCGPIVFDASQQAALLEACEPDAVVQQMQACAPDLCRGRTAYELHATAACLLPLAKRYNIENVCSQALFCLTALSLGPEFHRQPPWADALQRVAGGSLSYPELLREIAS